MSDLTDSYGVLVLGGRSGNVLVGDFLFCMPIKSAVLAPGSQLELLNIAAQR